MIYKKEREESQRKQQTEFQYQITFNEFDTWHYSIGAHTRFFSKEDVLSKANLGIYNVQRLWKQIKIMSQRKNK